MLMASASVGVCLGCVAGVCAAMAAGKWLDGSAANINRVYPAVYYGVFLVALGWSFRRGARRGRQRLVGKRQGVNGGARGRTGAPPGRPGREPWPRAALLPPRVDRRPPGAATAPETAPEAELIRGAYRLARLDGWRLAPP